MVYALGRSPAGRRLPDDVIKRPALDRSALNASIAAASFPSQLGGNSFTDRFLSMSGGGPANGRQRAGARPDD